MHGARSIPLIESKDVAPDVVYMSDAIIQNWSTHKFLGEGRWLDNREGAKHFNTGAHAIEYCVAHKIDGYQMVLRFDGSFQVVDVPLRAGEIPCF